MEWKETLERLELDGLAQDLCDRVDDAMKGVRLSGESLDECAKRLRQRVEELERVRGGGVIPRQHTDYPNLDAIAHGTISGPFSEWPRVKPEAVAALHELRALREENARLTRERDEAREMRDTWHTRAEAHRQATELANAEVARLEGLIIDWTTQGFDPASRAWAALWAEAKRIRAQREKAWP